MSILHFTIINHWFFVGLKPQHWFIGYTLNPLAGHSLVHCIGTSHWKLTLVILTLDLIELEPPTLEQQSY